MLLPLNAMGLASPCTCHESPHICAPFRLLRSYIHFDRVKITDNGWFECQDRSCPPCATCNRPDLQSLASVPASASRSTPITPPRTSALPQSRIHFRSPESQQITNPGARKQPRIDPLVQTPLLVGPSASPHLGQSSSSLTPALNTLALQTRILSSYVYFCMKFVHA